MLIHLIRPTSSFLSIHCTPHHLPFIVFSYKVQWLLCTWFWITLFSIFNLYLWQFESLCRFWNTETIHGVSSGLGSIEGLNDFQSIPQFTLSSIILTKHIMPVCFCHSQVLLWQKCYLTHPSIPWSWQQKKL